MQGVTPTTLQRAAAFNSRKPRPMHADGPTGGATCGPLMLNEICKTTAQSAHRLPLFPVPPIIDRLQPTIRVHRFVRPLLVTLSPPCSAAITPDTAIWRCIYRGVGAPRTCLSSAATRAAWMASCCRNSSSRGTSATTISALRTASVPTTVTVPAAYVSHAGWEAGRRDGGRWDHQSRRHLGVTATT